MKARNYSRKREAILEKIQSTTCHPTADWVYQSLKPDYPDLSLGTVYRNIGMFKNEGDIVSVALVAGQERFDGNTEPHGHFVCRQCNLVIDFFLPANQFDEIIYSEEIKDAKIDRMDLTIYGTCKTCIESAKTAVL